MMQHRNPVTGQLEPTQILGKTVPVPGNLCFIHGGPENVFQVRSIEVRNDYNEGPSCTIVAEHAHQVIIGDIRHFCFEYESGIQIKQQAIQFFKSFESDDHCDSDRDVVHMRTWLTRAQRMAMHQ